VQCRQDQGAGAEDGLSQEGLRKREKPFFFGKKNQKTFAGLEWRFNAGATPLTAKVFLLLFLQKKKVLAASLPDTLSRVETPHGGGSPRG
jgi:hypothetical protein